MNAFKRKKVKFIGLSILAIGIFMQGCSSKYQINPDPSSYKKTALEKEFDDKKKQHKKLKQEYKRGFSDGYAKAKNEIKKLIPYLESLRASAELKNEHGLCLPPVFLDKSDKSNIKIIVGKAHICENFTMNNVFDVVKDGIPGLPDYIVSKGEKQTAGGGNNSFASNISIDGMSSSDYFIEKPSKKEVTKIQIYNNLTNREILRNSNYQFSNVDSVDNYLVVEFKNSQDLQKFCSTYKICKIK